MTGGIVVWIYGLSGAGKTTLAQMLREELSGRLQFRAVLFMLEARSRRVAAGREAISPR